MRLRFQQILISGALILGAPAAFAGWDEGVAAFKAKNYAEAAREFEAITKDRADWAGGFLMLGRTQLLLDRPADAVNSLRKAYDLDPSSLETQLALSQAYLEAHRATEAGQLLGKVNAAGVPKERQSFYQQLVAKAAAESGRSEQAAAALAKAAAASPNDASVQFNYGVMALNSGDTPRAVAALEKAARLDPADTAKAKVLVQALVRLGRETQGPQKDPTYARAAEVARGLVAKDGSTENLLLLGETQLGANQYDAAIATFAQVSARSAGDWLPFFYQGQAQTALARYPDAESSLRKSLDRAASSADKARIWRQLGFVYEKEKNFAQAKSAYRSAGDPGSVARVEENEKIAAHNRQADAEAAKLEELKRQQELLRQQLQGGGAPPPG